MNETVGKNNNELQIYHQGSLLSIKWECNDPKCTSLTRAVRMCWIRSDLYLILSEDNRLYEAHLQIENWRICLQHIHSQVVDVQYYKALNRVYLVTIDGDVLFQTLDLSENRGKVNLIRDKWILIIFEPMKINENFIRFKRVVCSTKGVIFLSNTSEIYGIGSCGTHFNINCDQPKLIHLFENSFDIIDFCAVEDFFIFLISNPNGKKESLYIPLQKSRNSPDSYKSSSSLSFHSDISANSGHSVNLQKKIENVYKLINTTIYILGIPKKNGVKNEKLLINNESSIRQFETYSVNIFDNMSICSIYAEKNHILYRTIDNQLYYGCINDYELSEECNIYNTNFLKNIKHIDLNTLEECDIKLLESCFGDYGIILPHLQNEISEICRKNEIMDILNRPTNHEIFVSLQMPIADFKSYPLLLTINHLTIYNKIYYQQAFYTDKCQLLNQLKIMMQFLRNYHG